VACHLRRSIYGFYDDVLLQRVRVQNLMDESMLYATTLLAVAELLKSQRQLTIKDIHELEQLLQLMDDDYWRMTGKVFFSRCICICSSKLSISSRGTECMVGIYCEFGGPNQELVQYVPSES
jgi:hypothetical protein